MSSEQDPDRHEQIIEQLRARATWQTQPTLVPQVPEHQASGRPGGSQTWVYVAVAGVAAFVLLALFFSANATTGGGGGAVNPGAGSSGVVTTSGLTPEAAAEAAGRFYLAVMSGDYEAFEGLIDPSQKPLPWEIRERFTWMDEEWQSAGLSPSVGWKDGSFVVRIDDMTMSLSPDWGNAQGYFVDVHYSDVHSEDEVEMFLVPYGDTWVIQTVDGQHIEELFGD